jgi:predicted kinase
MDQLLRNVPKNSLQAMRIQMLPADNLGIVNSRELQQMTEKYRYTIGMIKVFYPESIVNKKEQDNSFERIKKDVDLIGELIKKKHV